MEALNTSAKFKVRTFTLPEIIGGTQKISAVPAYAHALFSEIFKGFCSDGPYEYTCQI